MSGIASEIRETAAYRTDDILNRETESALYVSLNIRGRLVYRHPFKVFQQKGSCVPWGMLRTVHHVVTIFCRYRDEGYVLDMESLCHLLIVRYDTIEHLLGEIYEVHLVDSYDNMWDAKQT